MNKINYKPINHIAFIMDGNGRWAKKRFMPRSYGHREGVKRIRETLQLCLDYNIKVMTLFCFSTENWKRDQKEIDYLFSLFDEFFQKDIVELNKKGCKVLVMGTLSRLPQSTQEYIKKAKELTKNNDKIIVMVRTSGEQRISNFVLWQMAYAELIFIDDYWPDFKKKQFLNILEEYTKRDRRFGGY